MNTSLQVARQRRGGGGGREAVKHQQAEADAKVLHSCQGSGAIVQSARFDGRWFVECIQAADILSGSLRPRLNHVFQPEKVGSSSLQKNREGRTHEHTQRDN
eukprot:COSAG04_NODE_664_length_11441_cov_5.400458_7_plen_102_part_00